MFIPSFEPGACASGGSRGIPRVYAVLFAPVISSINGKSAYVYKQRADNCENLLCIVKMFVPSFEPGACASGGSRGIPLFYAVCIVKCVHTKF